LTFRIRLKDFHNLSLYQIILTQMHRVDSGTCRMSYFKIELRARHLASFPVPLHGSHLPLAVASCLLGGIRCESNENFHQERRWAAIQFRDLAEWQVHSQWKVRTRYLHREYILISHYPQAPAFRWDKCLLVTYSADRSRHRPHFGQHGSCWS
jgi:hypothetical protein